MRYLKSAMAGLLAALVVAALYVVVIGIYIEREATPLERKLTSQTASTHIDAAAVVRDVKVLSVLWLAVPTFAVGFFWRLRRDSATAK